MGEAMPRKPLTVTLHVAGHQVDSLTDEQCERMAKRLSDTMSRYYTAHTDEYQKLLTDKELIMLEKKKLELASVKEAIMLAEENDLAFTKEYTELLRRKERLKHEIKKLEKQMKKEDKENG